MHRKKTVSKSLFNEPVVCYFSNKRFDIDAFLWVLRNCQEHQFFQEHLETPDSVFMEHICKYNIIKFSVG